MNRYQHIKFNYKFEGIQKVINILGAYPIWSLSHIVHINEYEAVAVFEAWDCEANEEREFGRIPIKEILGTEPTLQDVLLAIPKCTEIYLDLKEGLVFEMGLGRGRIYYNLNLSLFNQTDEVKQQLLELMK